MNKDVITSSELNRRLSTSTYPHQLYPDYVATPWPRVLTIFARPLPLIGLMKINREVGRSSRSIHFSTAILSSSACRSCSISTTRLDRLHLAGVVVWYVYRLPPTHQYKLTINDGTKIFRIFIIEWNIYFELYPYGLNCWMRASEFRCWKWSRVRGDFVQYIAPHNRTQN